MRVLVAGGAGFIGGHVCEALLNDGAEVIAIDNYSTGAIENVAPLMYNPRFLLTEGEVESAPMLERLDLVIHLASPASPVHYGRLPLQTMSANSQGTRRLLDIAAENGARFLFASTSEVYGDPLVHPQTEDYWGNVNPNGVRACYDESKRFGEALTMSYCRAGMANVGIVRIFNTYGPRMSPEDGRVVPTFIAAALRDERLPIHGDGMQTRSFCYVSDLVTGLLAVARDRHANGEIFNVGNPHETTMLDLAHTVISVAGRGQGVYHKPIQKDDPTRRRPDIRRLQLRYGWSPSVKLEDGLRDTVAHFRTRLETLEAAS